jgi:hypothetical protein
MRRFKQFMLLRKATAELGVITCSLPGKPDKFRSFAEPKVKTNDSSRPLPAESDHWNDPQYCSRTKHNNGFR